MNNRVIYLITSFSLFIGLNATNQAQALPNGGNSIGAEAVIQNSTGLGINGKFGVTENISIRPRVVFSSEKRDNVSKIGASGTEYGVAATYDFKPSLGNNGSQSPTIFVGPELSFWNGSRRIGAVDVTANGTIVSAIAGVEYPVTEALDLTGKIILPLSATGTATAGGVSGNGDLDKTIGFAIGAAYRF